jgi:hypothetical protein
MITPLPHSGAEVVEGTVARVNDRGLVLDGEDCWLNVSRYAKPAPKLPQVGETVRVYLDKDGYIRDVEALRDEERVRYAAGDGVDVPPPEEPSRQVPPAQRPPTIVGTSPDKDTQIRRMNAVATATAMLSSGGHAADPDEVLRLAERIERWVSR